MLLQVVCITEFTASKPTLRWPQYLLHKLVKPLHASKKDLKMHLTAILETISI